MGSGWGILRVQRCSISNLYSYGLSSVGSKQEHHLCDRDPWVSASWLFGDPCQDLVKQALLQPIRRPSSFSATFFSLSAGSSWIIHKGAYPDIFVFKSKSKRNRFLECPWEVFQRHSICVLQVVLLAGLVKLCVSPHMTESHISINFPRVGDFF